MAKRRTTKIIKSENTIEDTFKQKNLREHIRDLPDTYIGGIEHEQKLMWIMKDGSINNITQEQITLIPGLYKIFDEIIVNACDHSKRCPNKCTIIKVYLSADNREISVWNNGPGIPVAIHKDLNIYVPEMIFGHLLTSTNYDKNEKIVGGKNGYGAKLTNIFSVKFTVETVDSERKKKYVQEFFKNMEVIGEPLITSSSEHSYTKITFVPDYQKFNMDCLTDDMKALFNKRVYDLAMCCSNNNVKVYLNDELIKCKTFVEYINLHFVDKPKVIYEKINPRWQIGIVYDKNSQNFNQISFVNGIWTYQGGTHVNYVMNQITGEIIEHIKKKYKIQKIKMSQIKDYLTLFLECTVEDPSFNSQTKEMLTTKQTNFGSSPDAKFSLSNTFISKLIETGIIEEIVSSLKTKEVNDLNKTDGKKTQKIRDMTKLDDAELAGTGESEKTRLFLTEGDSAKAFALAGLEVIGRRLYGVYPLKGKLLNVRNATPNQIKTNKEFVNLKKILGLKQGMTNEDTKKLRYGGIIILTDQDDDGTHIKGLILNMMEHYWPSIIANNKNFVQTMVTPIIKVYKKSDAKKLNPIIFYNKTKYDDWKLENKEKKNKYIVKYYKGLGTSTEKEAKEEFKKFDVLLSNFVWDDKIEDSESLTDNLSHKSLVLAFDKNFSDARKDWLGAYDRNIYLPDDQNEIKISEFINKSLIHFSNADVVRSIPSICDGLKPAQRKIMYASFLRGLNAEEIKVAQFASYTAGSTAYHHGENSLCEAIVNIAQNFPGSNNINFLKPNGNFGYRRVGGKEHASPRYINTALEKITSKIFRKEDEVILNFLEDDGRPIEPEHFAPIIPTILVNGSVGIGTGFSTIIYPYNPKDIVNCIKQLINKEDFADIHPWFRGFKGQVIPLSDQKYELKGAYSIVNENTVVVTEIPIIDTIDSYKKTIESKTMLNKDDTEKIIEDYKNNSGNNNIYFEIYFRGNELQNLVKSGELEKFLKLSTTISLTNLHLHNSQGKITKYSNAREIISEFYVYRHKMYELRKEYYVKILLNEMNLIKYKVKFIDDYLNKKIIVERAKHEDVLIALENLKYPKLSTKINADEEDKNYNYLTPLGIFSLTQDKIDELNKEYKNKQAELDDYKNTSIENLWLREICEFELEYDKYIRDNFDEDGETVHKKKRTNKITKKKS